MRRAFRAERWLLPARPIRAAWTVALLATVAALTGPSSALGKPCVRTHQARVLNVTETAHLCYVGSSGSLLIEEGEATGALPGTVKLQFIIGPTVTGTFTIHAHQGSIIGRGTGTLHSSGAYSSFGGTMTVTHGTGRYAHAHGHGGFYGVIDRKTYAITVQTTGTLAY